MTKGYLIKSIKQKDNFNFSILWNDEVEQEIRLSDLQRNCPCANCVDEATGQRLNHFEESSDSLKAIYIRSVGRYAIQVQFTSGCSTGIYSFEMLRQMQKRST